MDTYTSQMYSRVVAQRHKRAADMAQAGASVAEIADAIGWTHGYAGDVARRHRPSLRVTQTHDLDALMDQIVAHMLANAGQFPTTRDVAAMIHSSTSMAVYSLNRLCDAGKLIRISHGKSRNYQLPEVKEAVENVLRARLESKGETCLSESSILFPQS